MSDPTGPSSSAAAWLRGASIDPAVSQLRPDYRARLITVAGVVAGPSDERSDERSDALLQAAEASARHALTAGKVEDRPHVAAWRDAYKGFGAKPQKFRNTLEQLLRRAEAGLPRVNKIVDAYNAVCVTWQIPIGGEEFAQCAGPPRLLRATGHELLDTVVGGQAAIEYPEPGEVIWADEAGVTCRRWNWRQGRRTAITKSPTSAVFILRARPIRRSGTDRRRGRSGRPPDPAGTCRQRRPAHAAGVRSDRARLGPGLRDVELLDGPGPGVVRGFAACLASVTQVPLAALPRRC